MSLSDCKLVVVVIVPTGIGAEIGGHAGDANPVVKLLGAASDLVITHPNVVNASDINEMPSNCWYVDGWLLDAFLEGRTRLRPVSRNRILVVANKPIPPELVNAVSAARVTIGATVEILPLDIPLRLIGTMQPDGSADGRVYGWKELVQQVRSHDFDALAIWSKVEVEPDVALHYVTHGGVNPWGAVEARASRLISERLKKPVAHAPRESGALGDFQEVVDPRLAAEIVSVCYLHSVLKGLHRAPQPSANVGLSVEEVTCLVSPAGCVGQPHRACQAAGIPIVVVAENTTVLKAPPPTGSIVVSDYLAAAGVLSAYRAGVGVASVRRPISATKIK